MNIKNFVRAVVVGLIVGVVIGLLAFTIGAVPHLVWLRTYDTEIGLGAGLLAFLFKWDEIS